VVVDLFLDPFLELVIWIGFVVVQVLLYLSLETTKHAAAWDTVDRQTVEIITPKVCTCHIDETCTVFSIVESLILFL
jgi:hypothetical protein